MKHPRVKIGELTKRLRAAAAAADRSAIAKRAKVDVSRVSRFLNGDFKKLTPVLLRLCKTLKVSAEEYVAEPTPGELPADLVTALRRIVGRDSRKARAALRLVRSLEVLVTRPPRRARLANRVAAGR